MSEESKQISFRVSSEDYKQIKRIAELLAENGKILNNGVGTLAKALVFVKINEFIQIELMQKEANERQALETRKTPPRDYGNV